jgi:hypothetical protein
MGSLLAFTLALAAMTVARADVTTVPASANPVVWVALKAGSITVHTWDRTDVAIDADPGVQTRHFNGPDLGSRIPPQVTMWSHSVETPDGTFTLPAETFVLPPMQDVHDAIMVRGIGNVTITVPSHAALVTANVGRGDVAIDNYRNGVFITHVGTGSVRLENVAGTGAVQVVNGPIFARNSDFSRIRARTLRGNIVFEHCNSKQIEATSVVGSVFYDNGTFEPGLARFESERGNVGLGVASGSVQINAHSETGAVHSGFGNDVRLTRNGAGTQAVVGSGGPVVTATSNGGAVLLYRGALRDNPKMQSHVPPGSVPHRHRRPPYP